MFLFIHQVFQVFQYCHLILLGFVWISCEHLLLLLQKEISKYSSHSTTFWKCLLNDLLLIVNMEEIFSKSQCQLEYLDKNRIVIACGKGTELQKFGQQNMWGERVVSNFLLVTLLISRADHSNYSHMECWRYLLSPSTNFIVMVPKDHPCTIAH